MIPFSCIEIHEQFSLLFIQTKRFQAANRVKQSLNENSDDGQRRSVASEHC